ncbi:MAG: four-carbon acid sugar kinase family protein, partial [Betaproteobacteria bacterium]
MDHQIPKTLIIADDLTGALDAAGPFCDRGLRVATIVDPQSLSSKIDLSKIDVLAVNSDSRHV